MKSLRVICFLAIAIITVNVSFGQGTYGKKVNEKKAISMQELQNKMKDKTEVEAIVSGKVSSVCQSMGCWMKMEKPDGTAMMVRMKDHKFFLPKDITGKNCVIKGVASVKTTTVEMLKHFAEDEGKSKEYIDGIKEPKTDLVFEAAGVLIK
jgi:hypothetical protein